PLARTGRERSRLRRARVTRGLLRPGLLQQPAGGGEGAEGLPLFTWGRTGLRALRRRPGCRVRKARRGVLEPEIPDGAPRSVLRRDSLPEQPPWRHPRPGVCPPRGRARAR